MKRFFLLNAFFLLLLSCSGQKAAPEVKSIATITAAEGAATITRKAESIAATAGLPLMVQDTIETKAGKVKFAFIDESTVALSENSKIILTEFLVDEHANFRKSTMDMAKGQIRSVVSKHFSGAGSETNIQTPTIVAGIRGTELAVTADDKQSDVYVMDGKVEVYKPSDKENRITVEKDMFVSSVAGKPLEAPKAIPEKLRRSLDSDYIPSDFKEKVKVFEDTYKAKKSEMEHKAKEAKKKIADKKKDVEDKIKTTKETFERKAEEKKSELDKQREEMLRKMKENLKPPKLPAKLPKILN